MYGYECDNNVDSCAVARLHERYKELAAMFKEKMEGSKQELDVILSRFCLQEGVRHRRAVEYLSLLKKAGIIKLTNGNKSWKYNSHAEWELFGVEI